jgi:superfamily II DNA or RNA helicase
LLKSPCGLTCGDFCILITKYFREYQSSAFRRLVRSRNNGKDAILIFPTGSGKTAIARNFCSHLLNHQDNFGINKIVITTPQKQILSGFMRTNEEEWIIKGKHSSQKINETEIVEIPNTSIEGFLKGSSGGTIAISCVQSFINSKSNAFNPFESLKECSNILWVIDEAHHIESEQLSKIIKHFKKKNGKILYLTATPYNENGPLSILNDPNVEIIHRSLGEHMKDGFSPEIEMSYNVLNINAGFQS